MVCVYRISDVICWRIIYWVDNIDYNAQKTSTNNEKQQEIGKENPQALDNSESESPAQRVFYSTAICDLCGFEPGGGLGFEISALGRGYSGFLVYLLLVCSCKRLLNLQNDVWKHGTR